MKGWNMSRSRRIPTTLLPEESLKSTAAYWLSGSANPRNMEGAMVFASESHSSSQREWPNNAFNRTRAYAAFFCHASVGASRLTWSC